MKPVLTLSLPPLPLGLDVVMNALGEGKALIVGGAVRAAIMGEAWGDFDIATPYTPDKVTALLEKAGIKVVPTGIDHGTVTAVAGGQGYEVTTLRRDVETDGRRAVVAYTDDWVEDARRRDFTMNTLLMDLDGRVYDPLGEGVMDLKAGRVRFVGDAATRIAEDYLRILRFFRFHARYGKGEPDGVGLAACAVASSHIAELSRERITHEIERLLQCEQAGATIVTMKKIGIMPNFFQVNFNQSVYDMLRDYVLNEAQEVIFPTLFAYSVWENNVEFLDAKLSKYIVFSNKKMLATKNAVRFVSEHTDSIRKNLYRFGKEITLAGELLSCSINVLSVDRQAFKAVHQEVLKTPVPQFPLKAADILKVTQLREGPELGAVLKKVEAWWLENDTRPDHQACVEYGKSIA